jgi:hypothetical protein
MLTQPALSRLLHLERNKLFEIILFLCAQKFDPVFNRSKLAVLYRINEFPVDAIEFIAGPRCIADPKLSTIEGFYHLLCQPLRLENVPFAIASCSLSCRISRKTSSRDR